MARAALDEPVRERQAKAAQAARDEVRHVRARVELRRHLAPSQHANASAEAVDVTS